jgi:hypothetical protein
MKATRAQYTLEFKQDAVRLVESGQSIAALVAEGPLRTEYTIAEYTVSKRTDSLRCVSPTNDSYFSRLVSE